ncbi:MAG: hypothetical protein WC027_02115 [Candidatus Paceibacterota bacterium]
MNIILVILGYLKWHYGKAVRSLFSIWKNFLYFIFDFFSISTLFKNFFDPWKRMNDIYPKPFNLKIFFYTFITNLITRIVGALMRFCLLIISLICCLLFIAFLPIALIVWILLPLIVLVIVIAGIFLIFK